MAAIHLRQLAFKLRAFLGIRRHGQLAFQLNDLRIKRRDFSLDLLQRFNSRLTVDQRLLQVRFDLVLMAAQFVQLLLQHRLDRVGFRDQVLQLILDRGRADTFRAERAGAVL